MIVLMQSRCSPAISSLSDASVQCTLYARTDLQTRDAKLIFKFPPLYIRHLQHPHSYLTTRQFFTLPLHGDNCFTSSSSSSSSSSTNFIATQVLKQNFRAAVCHVLHYSCNVNAAVDDSLRCRMICGSTCLFSSLW